MTASVTAQLTRRLRQGHLGRRRPRTSTICSSARSMPSTVEGWLRAWSRLEELVTEAAAQAMIAYTIDTSDPDKEKDHLRFSTEILPKMEERSVELARRFVALGHATPDLATTLARFRTSIEIFREANIPLFSELEELSARYQRITGSMTVEWDGVERPLPQLQPYLKSPDRAVRERAFRAVHPAVHRGAGRAGRPVRPDVRAAPAGGPKRRASPIFATTSFRPSSDSTTPRPTASDSTRRSSAPRRRPSSASWCIGGSGLASTRFDRGTWRSIPTARPRCGRSRRWTSSSGRAPGGSSTGWTRRSAASSRP